MHLSKTHKVLVITAIVVLFIVIYYNKKEHVTQTERQMDRALSSCKRENKNPGEHGCACLTDATRKEWCNNKDRCVTHERKRICF